MPCHALVLLFLCWRRTEQSDESLIILLPIGGYGDDKMN